MARPSLAPLGWRACSTSGGWSSRKGIGNIISALAELPGVELVVAGEPERAALGRDPEARRLRRLAAEDGVADRVQLRGRLSHGGSGSSPGPEHRHVLLGRGAVSSSLVVIGDALLDREVEGGMKRLSPDAPVPVFDEHRTRSRPGGAAMAAWLAAAEGREVRRTRAS
jgi:hypothetical protein